MTIDKIRERAEKYYYGTYTVTLDWGEEFRRDMVTNAYLAGAKDNTSQWHKVAAGDLPKETGSYITNIGVLEYDFYGDGVFRWHTPFCAACDYADVVDDDEVIAWCEIPKYTEEVSE